jgi:hypothetical protein
MVTKKKVTKKATTTKRATKNQFTKGNTKSKGFGRPAMTDAQKELSLKTRTQFKTMLDKYLITELSDLKKLLKKTKVPAIDAMIIKSLVRTIESGDQSQINWFLNHSLGKEKEITNINLQGSMENTSSIDLKKLSKEELLALKAIAEKKS